jgi:4-hydroxythreonine-4-phosphate dehydrogenase
MSSHRRIGITLGDVAGIGPEVVAKALASRQLDPRFDYDVIGNPRTKRAADAADWIVEGAKHCLAGELAALVTAPVSKQLVAPWPGQTELLAHISKTRKYAMMLVGGPLRVALVTTHAPLRDVPKLITGRRIREVIELAEDFCRRIGIKRPRIGVAGLNPHAGEGGLFGDEEKRIIAPAIKRTHAVGPLPADTMFHKAYRGELDAVVAMYHDQGLAPLKMIAFDTGVNITLGLPFVRTSPDHGIAYDIAGKGIASPNSMIAAINLAARLARAR